MQPVDRLLLCVGLVHGLLGAVCLGLLRIDAAPILGLHPAWKPLKFAFSIAAFLMALAVLLPSLSASDMIRRFLSVLLSLSMSTEMAVIGLQALRGRRSHFNLEQPLDAAVVIIMFVGIFILLPAMGSIAVIATERPLRAGDSSVMSGIMTAAWRAGLWLFLFSAVSGFAMGGSARHTIGGTDGGPGMAVTNWSASHGDLRVPHFFAMHALQILPLIAAAISWLPLCDGARWTILLLGIGANAFVAVWTLLQAMASRPFW